eukprot:CAMPEP_0178435952 /NCGR_PEP_ID=MMETSP0689_2-20121128/34191_1 /TAXON_ID=160604 /ORGANISM="Amphidinium massartii, Strain CS-259" /LENGTH=349 /DNA_ID=CAMNT_0020058037 /DNA_START=31 /DNA_END=1080 /DNA_ORIENTATION=-
MATQQQAMLMRSVRCAYRNGVGSAAGGNSGTVVALPAPLRRSQLSATAGRLPRTQVLAGCVAFAWAMSEVCPPSLALLRRSRYGCRRSQAMSMHRRGVVCKASATGTEADIREDVQKLRAREIRDELISLGVDVSDAFDKDELAARLVHHRMVGTAPAPKEEGGGAAPSSGADSAPSTASSDVSDDIVAKCRSMSVADLRNELGKRHIRWADALDKDELVQRLAAALADEAQFSKSGRFTPGQVVELTGEELEEELKEGGTPILLDVYAQWCGPCKFMAPELEKAAATLGARVRVAKLDSDKAPAMSSQLRVGGLPTLILFDSAGVEMARQEGAMNEEMLLDFAAQAGI